MAVKVGIPRALLYYEYFPMWKTFFEELKVEIILSEKTTKAILNDGVKHCVDEACLPVKLFHGHILNLKDKVDYLFVPRLKSVAQGEYICPKFCGLPDMVKFSIIGLPPVIDTEINLRSPKSNLYHTFNEIGKLFSSDTYAIKTAYDKALKQQAEFMKKIRQGRYPVEILENKKVSGNTEGDLCIALIGHVYNIYDQYISMDILSKLHQQGIRVITPELLDDDIIQYKADLLPKKMFWSFGKRLLGSALHLLDMDRIDGIIYMMSFGCGIDAFVSDLCERKIRRKKNIPFFLLTLDEHSGEAGVNTRLEAFIDMIRWRKRNEGNISAHG
ncbi:MAG: Protein of unknown function CoA enzyme activase [Clostridia bacterium]|jgi:predicted nucleotide-binding protein (sugar kinase/HSP70/actin superfamily)|nr:Protein of unknown function CoA enzyme activase [Clostridia bacterium]